jgi:uncharacterized protein YukJ
MPLSSGYGVLIGTLNSFERDNINDYGQYYHENVKVNAPAGLYRCAIDVDSKQSNDGIEWRVVPLGEPDMKGVASMPDGWHLLPSNDSSGAIDYIRTSAFHRPGCNVVFVRFDAILESLRQMFNIANNPPWTSGNSKQALDILEPLLTDSKRLFVFGEPFTNGLGVHNIHQNQGDPLGTTEQQRKWWLENGIWQDGATIIQKNDNSFVAFLNKFKPQSYTTNNDGH